MGGEEEKESKREGVRFGNGIGDAGWDCTGLGAVLTVAVDGDVATGEEGRVVSLENSGADRADLCLRAGERV